MSAGLPYKVVALTDAFSVLPSSLRHKFKYTLGSDLYGTEGERFITFEASLPETAGRKLMLTFRPKTQDDLDLVRSYIPAQSTSEEVDFAQIPDSLPGYLIQMTADFYQDQDVLYSADVGNFGENLFETIALWNPSFGWSQANNSPLVGESRAIGIDRQGINPVEVAAVQTELESIDAVLASEDAEEIAKLTKNQIIGGTFYSTIFNYFAVNSIQDQIQANSMGVVTYRLPSFGVFGTSLQTEYFYGTPRNVRMTGLVIDVDHLAVQSVAKDNDRSKVVQYTLLSGNRASAMEHEVPEAAFSSDDKPAQGISAVKALSIASNEGQKIWTIDIGNLSEALSAINLSSEVESDIRNAVNSGKIAIAHEAPVAFANGSNAGYLLLDTQTGAGAYMIAGGENGGFLDMLDGWLAKLEALIGDLEGWLGDAGPFLRPLQKAISQVKRLVRNIRGLIELVQTCNGVFTVVATLILAFAIRFIIAPIVAAAVGLGALICPATGFGAFVCLGLWATFVTAVVAEATNTFLEGMYDTFINSPLCRAQL